MPRGKAPNTPPAGHDAGPPAPRPEILWESTWSIRTFDTSQTRDSPISEDLRKRLQDKLGNAYILDRELGGGGMSRVFTAEETALARKVVIKVLPEELIGGVNVDRFKREIQFAARLQHPHIVQVLTAGEMDGSPFYTMPFVEGESVRARLLRLGALSMTEVIGILRDVAKALSYAHDHNVAHRDIKPDNVLLSGGSAAVADFGIAKAISAARTDERGGALTQVGTSIGTPAYMAPEQAAGDPGTDHRADIYSYGCLAYELLTGTPPFSAKSPQKLLAAHMAETPKHVCDLRPDTPEVLADLVMKCLAKEADDRPQRAADIVRVLENVTSGTGHVVLPPILFGGRRSLPKALAMFGLAAVIVPLVAKAAIIVIGLPEWVFPGSILFVGLALPVILFTAYVQRVARRSVIETPVLTPGGTPSITHSKLATIAIKASPHMSWRRTALGSAYAFAGFVLLVGGFMLLRSLGLGPAGSLLAAGVIDKNEKILIADFSSPRSDTTLGPTVTEAFRAALAQSRSINVLQPNAVADALRLMQKPSNTRIDFAVAREIATREGLRAVIDGEVLELGGRYVISTRLVSPETGQVLTSFRENAESEKQILSAIDNLAKDMRAKIGESLKSVRAAPAAERVTTPSLDALRKYVQAVRLLNATGEWARSATLLNEAIAIDSGFAMAYRRLAIEYSNRGDPERAMALLQKAFDHRDRLSEAERYLVIGTYYSNGPHQDINKSNAAYEQLIEIQPDAYAGLNNLALNYVYQRRFGEAEKLYRKYISMGATGGIVYRNAMYALISQRKFAEANALLPVLKRTFPNYLGIWRAAVELQYATGTMDSAAALARMGIRSLPPEDFFGRAILFDDLSGLAYLHGKFREGKSLADEAAALRENNGLKDERLSAEILFARAHLWANLPVGPVLQNMDKAVARYGHIEALPTLYLPDLVGVYAKAGRADIAKALAQIWETNRLKVQSIGDAETHNANVGKIALAEKRYSDAIDALNKANTQGCTHCTLPLIAIAYENAGKTDSAIAVMQTYLSLPGLNKLITDRYVLAPTYESLGRLYEQRGDRGRAIESYQKFATLWRDADPDLQPRVIAARAKIAQLRQ